MRDLNDLMYFAAVVEHGGFTAASRALDVPKSTLSRRIGELETRLNVRLLHRSTRRLAVTEVGQQFFLHCKAMLVEADAAESVAESTHAEPCGTLHVSCPIALLHMQVSDILVAFAARYPLVRLQISGLNRAVDLISEGVDIALRVRPLPLQDSDLAMRTLGESSQCLVASPALVDRIGPPQSPLELQKWPSLGNGNPSAKYVWSLSHASGRTIEVPHLPRLATTDMQTLSHAAQQGLGLVQLPSLFVRKQLDDGALVAILPEWRPPPQIVHAVFPSRRGLVSSVRALLDFMVAHFATANQ